MFELLASSESSMNIMLKVRCQNCNLVLIRKTQDWNHISFFSTR